MRAYLLCLLGASLPLVPVAGGVRGEEAEEATPVGQAVCRGCHSVEASHWDATIHAVVASHPRSDLQARACESCHGPGSAHLSDPTDRSRIIAFTSTSETPIEALNAMCLDCHSGGQRLHWPGSAHELQGLACSDCHNPMARTSARGLLAQQSVSRTCYTCHPQQRAEFRRRSHMPLPEGKIACSDCHNPHGSYTDPLIKGDTINQLCYRCHAEKRGPFLWEHAPARENCLSCHVPHGSNHDALLVTARPFLCQQCHSQPGGFGHANDLLTAGNLGGAPSPDERALNRSCTNCHIQIHGSNHPAGARFHR